MTEGIIDTHEIAPGIHRIETIEDDKLHGYHVLEGPSGPTIVDPGYEYAPTGVYEPFLDEHGWGLDDVDLALVTHADADHFGGNHRLRDHAPNVSIAAHAADVPLIESVDRILDERYSKFEAHGITYPDDVTDWLTRMMGPDTHVDLALRGGETLRVRDRRVRLLHTPGHTRGHLMIHDPEYDAVIGADGFFGRGLFDVDDEYLQPPPYFLYPEYKNTIQLVDSIDPQVLSFTHYELYRGAAVGEIVDESLDFAAEMEQLALDLARYGPVTLSGAIHETVDRRGDFGLNEDLALPLSAHFGDLTDRGLVERHDDGDAPSWVAIS